jgi:hypothetical protein
VLHPCFDGRLGHPPLVSADLAPAILAWSGEGGLRAFWGQGGMTAREVHVADEAILLDVDTDEAYRRLLARLDREDVPSADACRVLMTQVAQVPEAVWRHCQAVAAVAEAAPAKKAAKAKAPAATEGETAAKPKRAAKKAAETKE